MFAADLPTPTVTVQQTADYLAAVVDCPAPYIADYDVHLPYRKSDAAFLKAIREIPCRLATKEESEQRSAHDFIVYRIYVEKR